jgi:hypothetical protein
MKMSSCVVVLCGWLVVSSFHEADVVCVCVCVCMPCLCSTYSVRSMDRYMLNRADCIVSGVVFVRVLGDSVPPGGSSPLSDYP